MMKIKNPYIAIVAIFILGISVYSCRKELMDDQVALDPKISWANDYFKTSLLPNEGNVVDAHNYVSNQLQANLMSKKKENHKIPIWQKAMEGRTADYEFVEVPLKYTTKVTPMLYRSTSNSPQTADKSVLKASLDRLIIFKKRNGDISQRIITFIPTKAYLDRHNGDISHNRINKLDKDFDGVLIYRKWSGAFESALIVKNGKGTKRVLLTKFASRFKKASFEGEDEVCGTFDLLEWFVDCEYEGDNPVPISCSEPYSVVIGQIDIPCPEDDPEYDPCLEPENFELCFPDGSEGGGTPGDPPVQVDWGQFGTFDYSDESITTIEQESETEQKMTKYAEAFIYKPADFTWLKTKEKVQLTRILDEIEPLAAWQFTSITHESFTLVGNPPSDMNAEFIDVSTQGAVHLSQGTNSQRYNNDYVTMSYSFKDKRTKTINGVTYEKVSEPITGIKLWYYISMGVPAPQN